MAITPSTPPLSSNTAPRIMNGARAKLGFVDPNQGGDIPVFCGIFSTVSFGVTYDAQPAYILGRYSAAEIDYTSQDLVHITCSGWRVIGRGPHVTAHIPKLQDLLSHQYLTMVIWDRQLETKTSSGVIATITQVRPTGYNTTSSARTLQEITCSFVGIMADDESGVGDRKNAENSNSMDIDTGI